jgi:mono/diheme cytochrome c family protein
MKVKKYTLLALGTVAIAATFFSSCIQENADSPGWEYMPDMYRSPAPEANGIYISDATPDSLSNRMPAPGSIPRGWTPFPYASDTTGDRLASMFWKSPLHVTDSVEDKGKFLYDRYCQYCHGDKGDGQGPLVAKKKFPNAPPSYTNLYTDGKLTGGHVYHVITYGKGVMGSHATQLDPQERWEVIAYVIRLGRGGDKMSDWEAKQNAQPPVDSANKNGKTVDKIVMEPANPPHNN